LVSFIGNQALSDEEKLISQKIVDLPLIIMIKYFQWRI